MTKPILALLGLLACTSAFSVVYVVRQGHEANELAASRDQLRSSLADARSQIQTLSSKVDALSAARQQASPSPEPVAPPPEKPATAPAVHRRPVVRAKATVRRAPAEDPRWKKMQTQLAEEHEEIAKTQQDLQRTNADLQRNTDDLSGKLTSTRDELNGSIARTHDEVVVLQKRGERNYYEFQIGRSKQFQHVGPINVSLRKANIKHRYYDLAMIVDDVTLDKKHVNLYEPVWINLADRPQPVELVVNRIDKDHISGYITEPKYKNSEVAAAPPAAQPALKQR